MDKRFILFGLFFAFIFLTGFWLSRSGRPFNGLLLAAHKLVSVAAIVLLAVTAAGVRQAAPIGPLESAACAAAFLFLAAMIASGGMLSTPKIMPPAVLKVHQIAPYLAILSTTAALYLLLVRKG